MSNPSSNTTSSAPPELLEALRGLIAQTRQQLLRRVDVADAGRGLQPRLKRLDVSIAFET